MSKSHQIFLQSQIIKFSRKIIVFLLIILVLLSIVYFVGEKINDRNKKIQEQMKKIEMSSSKTSSINANREAIKTAFAKLSAIKRANKEHGRQYIIELLTKQASNAGVSNFIIENITEKTTIIPSEYDDLATNKKIKMFETVITFNNILNLQYENLMQSLQKEANGAIVLKQIEVKRVLENIDVETIDEINKGNKISILSTRIVIHWFFIK